MTTAIEALEAASKKHARELGVLTLRNNETKEKARFWLHAGIDTTASTVGVAGVYAVEMDSYQMPIMKRLKATGRITDPELATTALQRAHNNENSLDLPFALAQTMAVDEKDLIAVIRDFFLDVSAEALSWENVKATWKGGEHIDNYPIPPISPERLIRVLSTRARHFVEIAQQLNASPNKVLRELTVHATAHTPVEFDNAEEASIYAYCQDSFHTPESLLAVMGLTRVSVMKHIKNLWELGAIDVYAGGKNIRGEEISDDLSDTAYDEFATFQEGGQSETVESPELTEFPEEINLEKAYTEDFAGIAPIQEGSEDALSETDDNGSMEFEESLSGEVSEEISQAAQSAQSWEVAEEEEETDSTDSDTDEEPLDAPETAESPNIALLQEHQATTDLEESAEEIALSNPKLAPIIAQLQAEVSQSANTISTLEETLAESRNIRGLYERKEHVEAQISRLQDDLAYTEESIKKAEEVVAQEESLRAELAAEKASMEHLRTSIESLKMVAGR